MTTRGRGGKEKNSDRTGRGRGPLVTMCDHPLKQSKGKRRPGFRKNEFGQKFKAVNGKTERGTIKWEKLQGEPSKRKE